MSNKKEEHGKIRIVILYHHPDDKDFKIRLRDHLSHLIRKSIADIWDEGMINAGAEQEKEIQIQIQSAEIVLFLISASSLAHDSLNSQLKKVIHRHEQEGLSLIPIRARSFVLEGSDLEKYQILPRNGKPVNDNSWNDADEPYKEISEETTRLCEQILQRQRPMLRGNKQLNPEFYELEQSFISSPDVTAMAHSKFDDYSNQPRSIAYFKVYKEQLADLRIRMMVRRDNFCEGNITDINMVISLLKGVNERLQKQHPIFVTRYWRDISNLIEIAEKLKDKVCDPKFSNPNQVHIGVATYILPFCRKVEEFENAFENLASHSIIDNMHPISSN